MEGKRLKNFIIATWIWTVFIIALIVSASSMICNMWYSIIAVIGLVILWTLINTFITVHFLKKNPR